VKKFILKLEYHPTDLEGCFSTGILGYALSGPIPLQPSAVYLKLYNNTIYRIKAVTKELADKFECSTLLIEPAGDTVNLRFVQLEGWNDIENISILVREEWLEEDKSNTPVTIGDNALTQMTGPLGSVPKHIIVSCQTEAGFLFKNENGDMILIYADMFPFSVQIIFEKTKILEILDLHSMRNIYARQTLH